MLTAAVALCSACGREPAKVTPSDAGDAANISDACVHVYNILGSCVDPPMCVPPCAVEGGLPYVGCGCFSGKPVKSDSCFYATEPTAGNQRCLLDGGGDQ